VPVKFTVCGLFDALSAKVSVADSLLVVLGANWAITVQLFPAATVKAAQVSETIMKSAMLGPLGVTVVIARSVVPMLVTISVIALLVVPCVCVPKASGFGVAEKAGPLPATEKA
jgi:hypothetical protein